MRIKLFVVLVGLFLIVGCSNTTSNVRVVSNANRFCDNDIGYCLGAAETFWGKGAWQKSVGMSGQIVDHLTSNEVGVDSPEFTMIEVYHSTPSCAPEAIGIGSPEDIQVPGADNTIFGRMDYRETYWTMDFPIAFTDICGPQSGEAIYAFCSEKGGDPAEAEDDKRVVICISQQTDNAKLAEEIFKSFRWTEW